MLYLQPVGPMPSIADPICGCLLAARRAAGSAPRAAARRRCDRARRSRLNPIKAKFGDDRRTWLDAAAVGSGHRARLQRWVCFSPPAWTGSWTGSPDNPSVTSAVSAIAQVIAAASASGAPGRSSCKRQASGSNPLTGSQVRGGKHPRYVSARGTNVTGRGCLAALRLPLRMVAAVASVQRRAAP